MTAFNVAVAVPIPTPAMKSRRPTVVFDMSIPPISLAKPTFWMIVPQFEVQVSSSSTGSSSATRSKEMPARGGCAFHASARGFGSQPEIGLPYLRHAGDLGAWTGDHGAALSDHVGVVAERECEMHVLFDQENGEAAIL